MKAFHLLNSINVGNLAQQGQCAFDLDKNSSDYQSIVDLANNSKGIAGIQAKNILNHGFGLDLYDPAIFPELKRNA